MKTRLLFTALLLSLPSVAAAGSGATVRNNTVVRIDPKTNTVAAAVPVGRGPQSLAVAGSTVWVYNWDDHTVSALDARTNAVIKTLRVNGLPPSIQSRSLAADLGGAWVLSRAGGKGVVTRLGLESDSPLEVRLDGDPVSVATGNGSTWVGVKTGFTSSALLRLNQRTGAVTATVPLKPSIPKGGAADSSFSVVQSIAIGRTAVYALMHGGTIMRIDLRRARVTRQHALAPRNGIDLVAGRGALWALVAHPAGRNELVQIDPRSLRMSRRIASPRATSSGNSAGSLALGTDAIWWNGGDAGSVWRVDLRRRAVTATIRVTRPFSSFGDFLPYAATAGAGAVWITVRVAP
jgi:YVTN family beta-propeller protein